MKVYCWLSQLVFPGGSDGKESVCNTGDWSLIPGLGRSPGEGKINLNLKCGEQTKASQQNSGENAL
jgi:hypothetical protein